MMKWITKGYYSDYMHHLLCPPPPNTSEPGRVQGLSSGSQPLSLVLATDVQRRQQEGRGLEFDFGEFQKKSMESVVYL